MLWLTRPPDAEQTFTIHELNEDAEGSEEGDESDEYEEDDEDEDEEEEDDEAQAAGGGGGGGAPRVITIHGLGQLLGKILLFHLSSPAMVHAH